MNAASPLSISDRSVSSDVTDSPRFACIGTDICAGDGSDVGAGVGAGACAVTDGICNGVGAGVGGT